MCNCQGCVHVYQYRFKHGRQPEAVLWIVHGDLIPLELVVT